MDLLSFLPPLVGGLTSLITSAGQQAINKYLTPALLKPNNITEYIQMQQADIDKAKALADLEGAGTADLWVEDIRKLQRPLVGLIIGGVYIYQSIHGPIDPIVAGLFSGYAGYLFVDRSVFYYNQAKK